jgi:hypothetical protein
MQLSMDNLAGFVGWTAAIGLVAAVAPSLFGSS